MSTRKVEWIGSRTPLSDTMVNYRRMIGAYTAEEDAMLEAVTLLILPMVRVYGTTARSKGTQDGYSKKYLWGPKRFVIEMEESDAKRLFDSDPDEAEFRDVDREDHAERKPEIPWMYVTKALARIMSEAHNGPQLVLVGGEEARNTKQLDAAMERTVERKAEIAERRQSKRARR